MAKGKQVYVKAKKTKVGDGNQWSDKKKMEALTTYIATGTLAMTSAITGIPIETMRVWKRSNWWKERLNELQDEDNIQLNVKLQKVLEKSITAVEDRLDNGEFMYDPRTGRTVRIPAKLRDVHKITTDLIDKKQMLLKAAKPANEQSGQLTTDHLAQIAQAFAQFAQGQKPPPEKVVNEIVEGEYIEILEEAGYDVPHNNKDV